MKRIKLPNFTAVPNVLLDSMPEFRHNEFKVAMFICRHTFGFHQERKKMSLSYIERGCGLSRNTVINSLELLANKGILVKTPIGDSFAFELNLYGENEEVVQNLNHPSAKFELEVVQNLNTIKKGYKETTKEDSEDAVRYGFGNPPTRDEYEAMLEHNEFDFITNHRQDLYDKLKAAGWRDEKGMPIDDLAAYIRPVELAIRNNPPK